MQLGQQEDQFLKLGQLKGQVLQLGHLEGQVLQLAQLEGQVLQLGQLEGDDSRLLLLIKSHLCSSCDYIKGDGQLKNKD